MTIRSFTIAAGLAALVCAAATAATAQSMDSAPYDPATDPDIDLYVSHWTQSMPRHMYGSLIERDILVPGDPITPPTHGAVMKYLNRFVHATLDPRMVTEPTVLDSEQIAFYVLTGRGVIETPGESVDLHSGIAILIPEGLLFTIESTCTEPLTMYLVSEPVPAGFEPSKKLFYRDDATRTYQYIKSHWCYNGKSLLGGAPFSEIYGIDIITCDPMTIGQPHAHTEGCEEIWTTIDGDPLLFFGKELRRQPPGTAYMIPPDGKTCHSNINTTNAPVHYLYISVRHDLD